MKRLVANITTVKAFTENRVDLHGHFYVIVLAPREGILKHLFITSQSSKNPHLKQVTATFYFKNVNQTLNNEH
jgi:hypothetical protein